MLNWKPIANKTVHGTDGCSPKVCSSGVYISVMVKERFSMYFNAIKIEEKINKNISKGMKRCKLTQYTVFHLLQIIVYHN